MIQEITKDPTEEILSFFYGITSFVMDDIIKNSKASFISKEIILFYKDTPVPFKIALSGGNPQAESVRVAVVVSVPKSLEHQDVSGLMDRIVESGLGLAEQEPMPVFEKPILKTPKCLKAIRIQQNEQRTKPTST